MALGGLDEDGKNMYLVEIDGDIFVLDAGLKYPSESEQLGIEYIIPDFTYLLEHKDRVKGIFISHGHDDVMSALGHLLTQADFEVYATALTAKLLEEDFKAYKLRNKHIHIVKRNDTFKVANHIVHTFPVMQSIADGVGDDLVRIGLHPFLNVGAHFGLIARHAPKLCKLLQKLLVSHLYPHISLI